MSEAGVHKQSREAGFSLVEALLACFLLALVSATSIALLGAFWGGGDSQKQRLDRVGDLMRVTARLGEDLAHIVARPHGAPRDIVVFEGNPTKPCFLKFARRAALAAQLNPAEPDIESVRYCFEDGQIMRQSYDRPDATSGTKQTGHRLIGGIDDIEVSFFDGNSWQKQWFIGVDEGRLFGSHGRLPVLVKLDWVPATALRADERYSHVFKTAPGRL
ncbi:MAG: hypothetical protein EBT71_05575 [Alphaproteobacteria bacterium]|nr:hypothetical protein [Alphaproteobacteria bacterium]